MASEIERKFLITDPPHDYTDHPFEQIIQGYVVITDDMELRIRKTGNSFYQTIKTGEGLVRKETEIKISSSQFDTLWPLTENWRVEKKRYKIQYGNFLIELDIYSGRLENLIVAEVEFGSEDESTTFEPPDWFGMEITEDKRFKNKNLAIHGLPKSN